MSKPRNRQLQLIQSQYLILKDNYYQVTENNIHYFCVRALYFCYHHIKPQMSTKRQLKIISERYYSQIWKACPNKFRQALRGDQNAETDRQNNPYCYNVLSQSRSIQLVHSLYVKHWILLLVMAQYTWWVR